MMVMERRRDELADAEHSRLVKEARAGARAAKRMRAGYQPASWALRLGDGLMLSLARFLSIIGEWLLSLSCRLQTHVELLKAGVTEKKTSPCT